MSVRGPYFKWLKNAKHQIPKQTRCNRNKKTRLIQQNNRELESVLSCFWSINC